jgi:hypothetical protein
MSVEKVFGRCDASLGSFSIPFLLLFSEIIPCEVSIHLIKVQFVTKYLYFYWKDLIICHYFFLQGEKFMFLSPYDMVNIFNQKMQREWY